MITAEKVQQLIDRETETCAEICAWVGAGQAAHRIPDDHADWLCQVAEWNRAAAVSLLREVLGASSAPEIGAPGSPEAKP